MPGRRRPILLTVAILLLPAAFAQEEGPPPRRIPPAASRPSGRPAPEAQLRLLWFARKSALEVGDAAAAAGRIEEMTRLVRSERLDRVTWLARGFAYEGYEHLREGNYERAREGFDIARRFDPRLPEAQTGYAWAALRAGRGVGTFVKEYRKALWLRWETLQRTGGANAYWLSLVAMCLAAIIIVGVFVLRYHAMLRHDVAERMPRGWPEEARRVAGWAVLLGPLLVWVGGAWLLLYWCVILGRYMSGAERAIAAVVCIAFVGAGALAAQGVATAEIASDPTVGAVEEALEGGYGTEIITALQGAVDRAPDAVSVRMLLANTFERAGLHREAFEEYQGLLKLRPDDPMALNNLGNLYMRAGQTSQALVYYTRAVEADPRQAAFFHNLYLAQSDAIRPADAEASLRMLQDLDGELARALLDARGRSEDVAPITATVPADQAWRDLPRLSGVKPPALADHLRSPTAIGALSALALLGWFGLSRSPLRAQTCMRCGEPFCGRCKKELGAKECCAQCIHLFIKKDSIAPEIRARKMTQVERSSRRWRRLVRTMSLLAPGAGHLFAGRTITGTGLLAAWIAPLTILLLGDRFLLPPSLPVLDLPALSTLLTLLLMGLLWSAANLFLPRPPV